MRRWIACLAAAVAACTPTFDWREVASADGYRVLLPGKPLRQAREVQVPSLNGTRAVLLAMTSAGVGSTLFAVGVAALPSATVQDPVALQSTLAWFRAGLLRNVAAEEVREMAAPTLSRPARAGLAFEARGRLSRPGEPARPARLAARLYVVDDRLYQVVAMGAADALPDIAIETFLTSFRLN